MILSTKPYLVLGIGTDVGKTFFTTNYCHNFSNTFAIKPVVTGFSYRKNFLKQNSDITLLLKATKQDLNLNNINNICLYHHPKPISPHLVLNIDFANLINFCQQKIQQYKNHTLLIETAGGVFTPINYQKNFLHLAEALQIECILIANNYLGSINHTLATIEAIKNRNIYLQKIIINNHKNNNLTTTKQFIHTLNVFCQNLNWQFNFIEMKKVLKNT
jgi:dethiobiotin synthetase